MTQQDDPHDPTDPRRQQRVERRRFRRTPNFLRFMITGAFIGFVVGAIFATTGPDAEGYSERTGVALIGGILAAFGALIAGIIALVLERFLNRP